MIIDRLGGTDPLKNIQNTQKAPGKVSNSQGADSISVSAEAKEMAEAYFMSEVASVTPDVRTDKIAEIREKIKNPDYINAAVLNTTAERIMDLFGI